MPTLYRHGQVVEPAVIVAYYRTAGRDPHTIAPFPTGLRMIAGNSKALGPQDPRRTSWGCTGPSLKNADIPVNLREARRQHVLRRHQRAQARELRAATRARRRGRQGEARRHRQLARRHGRTIRVLLRRGIRMPSCGPHASLRASIRFPECWNGRSLDSSDHKSHMAYASYSRDEHLLTCPRSHRVAVPKLVLHVVYESFGGKGFHLSSRGTHTMHGDFFDVWDPGEMDHRVPECLQADLHCGRG